MDTFCKLSAGVLLTAILSHVLAKQGKDYALLLTLAVCAMVLLSAAAYLQPVLSFFSRLSQLGQWNSELLGLLLKIVGVGLISQIAGMVCSDAGNQSLGKALQILTTAVILWIALPLLEEMLTLIEAVLEAV